MKGLFLLLFFTCHAEYLLKYTYCLDAEAGTWITGEREFDDLKEALAFVRVKRTSPQDTFELSEVGSARNPMPSGKRHVLHEIPLEEQKE
jgi:hypothetical protein